jgi:hypothetical protein
MQNFYLLEFSAEAFWCHVHYYQCLVVLENFNISWCPVHHYQCLVVLQNFNISFKLFWYLNCLVVLQARLGS